MKNTSAYTWLVGIAITLAAFIAPATELAAFNPTNLAEIPQRVLAPLDAQALKLPPTRAMRVAVPRELNIGAQTDGIWTTLPNNHSRWRVQLTSAQAKFVSLHFDQFNLPVGAALMLFSPGGQYQQGPYTAAHNAAGQLWTPHLVGDSVLLQLTVPSAQQAAVTLRLKTLNHGFQAFWQPDSLQKSGSCNIDVVCPQGDAWRDEIRSVSRLFIAGSLVCTGTLLNNTAEDLKPLILTANHCIDEVGGMTPAEAAASIVAFWNFETSTCGGTPDGNSNQNQSGATLRARWNDAEGTDFALVELTAQPSASFNVSWAGWDRSDAGSSASTAIHHPQGDEKRISFDNDAVTITTFGESDSPGNGLFWRVGAWEQGTTEQGSSGSGLWNTSRRLIGNLSGGSAACDTPDGSDWYGRLGPAWEGAGSASSRLKDWLDPNNTGATTLNGRDLTGPIDNSGLGNNNAGGGGSGSVDLVMLLLLSGVLLRRWLARQR